ncbi:MAG: T9SS type A sorting domain-containing protein [Bacteroidetes bacterium]|nr:T9SS type A sorting domain-containing protein [Bacteroidota bacterium]
MKKLFFSFALTSNLFAFGSDDFGKFSTQSGYIENKGQIRNQFYEPNSDVKFILPMNGMNLLLKSKGFSYDSYKITNLDSFEKWEDLIDPIKKENRKINCTFHRIDVDFINCNSNSIILTEGKSNDYLNYYADFLPEAGATNVHTYNKVIYKNIYNNIDIEFVLSNKTRTAEYNFILHPGARLQDIQLQYKGAHSIELKNGEIKLKVNHGYIKENIPLSFWSKTGKKVNIKYQIKESNGYTIVGFNGLSETISQTLIIDPTPNLDWASYFGEGMGDEVRASTIDKNNFIYYSGITGSSKYIATSGAYQTTFSPGYNCGFITKFTTAGVRQWGTYYLCSGSSVTLNSISLDRSGNIITAGHTGCTGTVSTTGAYQTSLAGSKDILLVKLNNSGQRLWATYYGGVELNFEEELGFACNDTLGNIYLTGITSSTANITTLGSFQPNYYSSASFIGTDGFLAKFDSMGNRQWATYLGGEGYEYIHGICIGPDQHPIIGGYTGSQDSIATPGTMQNNFISGAYDGFIMKFTPSGMRQWGTYYGGDGSDYIYGINCDRFGNIGVCGNTTSGVNIATTNAYQLNYGYNFIGRLNKNGIRYWGTYQGPAITFLPSSALTLAFDSIGNLYCGGGTAFANNIATPGAYQTTIDGNGDAFILRFDSSGTKVFGTLFGGDESDDIQTLSVTQPNEIYFGGRTRSITKIATPGCHQPNYDNYSLQLIVGMFGKFSNTGAIGINEFTKANDNNELVVYPNPNSGEFTLLAKEDLQITIINELGVIVHKENYHTQKPQLKLNLPAGVYFINAIKKDGRTLNKKVMMIE